MSEQASPEAVEREVKKGQALELRIGGANYREIARGLKISVGLAHTLVTEGLAELRTANEESTEEVRRLEVVRLDGMLLKLWTKRDQPRVADTLLRLQERRARLLGLDLGKIGSEEPPPPPPSSQLPPAIHITLVAPTGTKVEIGETKAPAGETKGAGAETAG